MHHIDRCRHGVVISQCRCPGPKTTRIVPCPPGHDEPMHPQAVSYDMLVVGKLYDVYVSIGELTVAVALPYRGKDDDGRLTFGDGPNGVYVHPHSQPRIYDFEDTL